MKRYSARFPQALRSGCHRVYGGADRAAAVGRRRPAARRIVWRRIVQQRALLRWGRRFLRRQPLRWQFLRRGRARPAVGAPSATAVRSEAAVPAVPSEAERPVVPAAAGSFGRSGSFGSQSYTRSSGGYPSTYSYRGSSYPTTLLRWMVGLQLLLGYAHVVLLHAVPSRVLLQRARTTTTVIWCRADSISSTRFCHLSSSRSSYG